MEEELYCNECGWSGDQSELVSISDDLDDLDFDYCPYCKSSDLEPTKDEEE